jgi:hypothetical protein
MYNSNFQNHFPYAPNASCLLLHVMVETIFFFNMMSLESKFPNQKSIFILWFKNNIILMMDIIVGQKNFKIIATEIQCLLVTKQHSKHLKFILIYASAY